jgi:hypothetical protein
MGKGFRRFAGQEKDSSLPRELLDTAEGNF